MKRLSFKVYSVVALMTVVLIGIAAFSIYQMQAIGDQIRAVAQQDLPLAIRISELAVDQYEQSIAYERLLRTGATNRERDYQRAVEKFDGLSTELDEKFPLAIQRAQTMTDAAPEDLKTTFLAIVRNLDEMAKYNTRFRSDVADIREQFEDGNPKIAIAYARAVEFEGDHMDEEVRGLLESVEGVTLHATQTIVAEQERAVLMQLAGTAASMIVVLALVGWIVRGHIQNPLKRLTQDVSDLNTGRLDRPVMVMNDDEIGDVAKAVETFRQKLQETDSLRAKTVENQTAELKRADEIRRLNKAFERDIETFLASLGQATKEIAGTSDGLTETADVVSSRAYDIADRTRSGVDTLHTVAGATDQMSQSINEISARLQDVANDMTATNETSERVRDRVAQTVASSRNIGDVIILIEGIAEQTNLLALNATIEAARAGDAGRGFAVVAGEVKSLSDQTAKATRQIVAQIETLQQDAGKADEGMAAMVDRFDAADKSVSAVAASIAEQEATVRDIAGRVNGAFVGAQETADATADVTKSAANGASAAATLADVSSQLTSEEASMRTIVERYLGALRAA